MFSAINLGHMTTSPSYKDEDIILTYVDGDICEGDKKYSATITLSAIGDVEVWFLSYLGR